MGHRKYSAPRRGSLAYSPRGRAKSLVPRIRTWPKVEAEKPLLLGFPGYKAGTAHVITVDDRASRVAALVSSVPRDAGLSQKKPVTLEVGVSGGDLKAQADFVLGLIGKMVKFTDTFKAGMYVDVLGITKGKGFEGPITRFGVKRKQHKSRKSVRAVAVIGPWHPAAVMYTIARAGQMGFHQRTETGKRILLVGNTTANPITPAGGFEHFGNVTGDYAVVRGAVPGPASRFVMVRMKTRGVSRSQAPPQVIEVSTTTKERRS